MTRKAMAVQAREYERRLELLNGEATRLREMQITYLPREVCDSKMSQIIQDINGLKIWQSRVQGQVAIIAVIASGGMGLVIITANYLLGK